MSFNKDGVIIVLSSPSGAGKTTLVKKIAQVNNYNISISHTTRKPRTNEVNGKDYYFVSNEDFEKKIKNNEFLEYAKVFENYYGSSKKKVFDDLNKGENVIFDIDWQGTEQIKRQNLNYKLITFFILPPSKNELFKRLRNRDMKDKNIVDQRMKKFTKDIEHWKNYDFVVINDDLEKCYDEIMEYLLNKIKNLELKYNKKIIEDHIKNLRN